MRARRGVQLLIESLRSDPTNALVRCHYGKLLEAFRGDYDGAEAQYSAALDIDPNHIPALTFYSYLLRDLRNDTAGWRKIQGRKDLLMDPGRVHTRNSDTYYDPAVNDGDLRPLFTAIARGTSEVGPTAITPWEFLRVPGLSEHELRRLGYTREEARALQGGPQHFRLAAETWGMWHWHGFYQPFWKHRGRRYEPYCQPPCSPPGHSNGTRDAPCRLARLRRERTECVYHTDERLRRWVEWERGAAGGYFIGADGEPTTSVGVCMCVMCAPKGAVCAEGASARRGDKARGGAAECADCDAGMSSEVDDDNSTASVVWQRLKAAVIRGVPGPEVEPLRGGGPINYERFDQLEVSSEGDSRDEAARSGGFEDYDSLVATREALENMKHTQKTLHQDWLREHDRARDQQAAEDKKNELDALDRNSSLAQMQPTKWMQRILETRAKQAAAAASDSGDVASSLPSGI